MQYRYEYRRYLFTYFLAIFDTNTFVVSLSGALVKSVNNNITVPGGVKATTVAGPYAKGGLRGL